MKIDMRQIGLVFSLLLSTAAAAPLGTLVELNDGLDTEDPKAIQDDYVRLTLLEEDYRRANTIKEAVENWLGPDMVIIQSASLILIQAPRSSSERVAFLSALLELDIP